MHVLILVFIPGIIIGWTLRTMYQRFLWDTIVRLRRQMRGGSKRRTRRR